MNERLMQYLWSNSLFRMTDLKTTAGDTVVVINPGRLNTHAGPDFLNGRVRIADTVWAGNIELHLKSSDWKRHGHHQDEAYQNIILHVVLEDDLPNLTDNFPTLVLEDRIHEDVLARYRRLMGKKEKIACHRYISSFPDVKWEAWLNRLLAERWEERLKEWQGLWEHSGKDWRQLLYYRMAANFGFHVNKEAFLQLSISLPLKVLEKHSPHLLQVEALLFGQSGLLMTAEEDDYVHSLRQEYGFLRKKYKLDPIPATSWRFMRMRPSNFPTIRLAQFADLIHRRLGLFSKMMSMASASDILSLLPLQASAYWNRHYRLGVMSQKDTPKRLGKEAIYNIIINTIAPMQFLYAQLQGAPNLTERSVTLLQSIPPERNHIIQEWEAIRMPPKDAAASQALLQLFTNYCTRKRCLDCAVGHTLVQDSGIAYQTI